MCESVYQSVRVDARESVGARLPMKWIFHDVKWIFHFFAPARLSWRFLYEIRDTPELGTNCERLAREGGAGAMIRSRWTSTMLTNTPFGTKNDGLTNSLFSIEMY